MAQLKVGQLLEWQTNYGVERKDAILALVTDGYGDEFVVLDYTITPTYAAPYLHTIPVKGIKS